jgi:hypothetical protein
MRFRIEIPYHLRNLEPSEVASRVLGALTEAIEYIVIHVEVLFRRMLGEDAHRFAHLMHMADLARERFPEVRPETMPAWQDAARRLETLYDAGGLMPSEERQERYEALSRELKEKVGEAQYWALDCEVDTLRKELDRQIVDHEL